MAAAAIRGSIRRESLQRSCAITAAYGPGLPTLALRQVGSYLGYTDRDANLLAEAAPW